MGSEDSINSDARELEAAVNNAPTKDAALQLVLQAAEQSMAGLRLTKDAAARKQVNARTKVLLDTAESIKKTGQWKTVTPNAGRPVPMSTGDPVRAVPRSTRQLSKAEQIILLRASYVNGCKFPPWQTDPSSAEFELEESASLHSDSTVFSLSATQAQSLSAWQRLSVILSGLQEHTIALTQQLAVDLVQDAATDCSVVASLCTMLARTSKSHASLLEGTFFPFDIGKKSLALSANGKYVAKLNFNGAWRRVDIDDKLPVSNDARVIHVRDRNDPSNLWPALVEKMYLKVRGGYDFPGSNSGTDLWILTGWIPEQIFLQSDDTSIDEMWRRIWQPWQDGDVMITFGTGKMSVKAEREIGLASEHDYAVLDVRSQDAQQLFLIKNPWCRGSTWMGKTSQAHCETSHLEYDVVRSPRDLLNEEAELLPGTFWMDLHSVSQHFESIYINWNPIIFKHREDVHFTWDLTTHTFPLTYVNHPQFCFSLAQGGTAWVLLCRHFTTDRTSSDINTPKDSTQGGFIGISAYETSGKRLVLKQHPLESTPFVDSYQVLLRLSHLRANANYTLVPDQDGLPDPKYSFTMSVLSQSLIKIDQAMETHGHVVSAPGSWTDDPAGGNTTSPLFSLNPQYRIAVTNKTSMSILLSTTNQLLPVNVKLCISEGKRIHSIKTRDVLADSGDYKPCCTQAIARNVEPGIYTIVCSAYEAGQIGVFTLRISSDTAIQLRAFPREGAGRLRTATPRAAFGNEDQALAILLLPQRLTKFVALVKPVQDLSGSQQTERSMLRMSILQGDSFQHHTITQSSNGEFRDARAGARTEEIDLSPAMSRTSDLFLILERSFTAKGIDEERFEVEFFTESAGAVQTGDWQAWEVI